MVVFGCRVGAIYPAVVKKLVLIYNLRRMKDKEAGFTLVELMVSIAVIVILAMGFFDLFVSLLHSAIVSDRQSIALTLATNQMEYLKSLPYDNLAVAGGSIVSTTTIPGTQTATVNGEAYTIKTTINYADDAYDGCGSYPTMALEKIYCRNYPPPSGAPSVDTNPADYKDVTVTVYDKNNSQLATIDTQIASLVAETASNTGALFISVINDSGDPVEGATVTAVNSTTSPVVNVSDTTDQNGVVIFYDLPPSTTGYNYVVTASKSGYSSLTTIAPTGALQPTYSSQNLIAQSSSYVTMTIKETGVNSLIVQTTDTSGNPLPNAKVYIKGGYKKYTATSDTSYYYDNKTPTDTRPTTDSNGLTGITNLVPGGYYFCGDSGATNCSVGATTYYLAAAVPYLSGSTLQPVNIPIDDPNNPPTTTFTYNSTSYLQEVRLMMTTNASFPRITSINPADVSIASGTLSNLSITLNGANLPCSATASSCSTHVSFVQGSNTYTASCTGTSGTQVTCTVNMSGATTGIAQLVVTVGSNTLTLPGSPLQGGILVTP